MMSALEVLQFAPLVVIDQDILFGVFLYKSVDQFPDQVVLLVLVFLFLPVSIARNSDSS